jgi:hypothetical protein
VSKIMGVELFFRYAAVAAGRLPVRVICLNILSDVPGMQLRTPPLKGRVPSGQQVGEVKEIRLAVSGHGREYIF